MTIFLVVSKFFYQKMAKMFSTFYINVHQFSILSSTISSYFNSSYYSFLTFLTLYPIFVIYLKNKFLIRPNGRGFNPQTPLPTPLTGLHRVQYCRSCNYGQRVVCFASRFAQRRSQNTTSVDLSKIFGGNQNIGENKFR